MMEIFLRVTIRVKLDEAHESAEHRPICIARQFGPVEDVERALSRHDNYRKVFGEDSRTMLVSILNS